MLAEKNIRCVNFKNQITIKRESKKVKYEKK